MDRIADYVDLSPLGSGNHGTYWLASTPARLGIPAPQVAVKVMQAPAEEDAFRRIVRELKAFAKVGSQHLVELYDAGQEGGSFYYAMEYLPHGSLEKPIRHLGRGDVLAAVADAARAAHDLHEAGMAHRDINPGNILLTATGAKLSDLGLVQVLSPGQTITGMSAIGSIEYLDPAIMRGERASRATDIWALGVSLHHALTGRSVYGELPANDPLLAVRRVLSSSPSLDPSLTPDEAMVVQACIAGDPAARFRTAGELARRIDALGVRS